MQDDVADAWPGPSTEDLVDPKRVCIAGASYGGYATLMGLIRHPELYRCGVGLGGGDRPAADVRLALGLRRRTGSAASYTLARD